jgi:hypothetical protein
VFRPEVLLPSAYSDGAADDASSHTSADRLPDNVSHTASDAAAYPVPNQATHGLPDYRAHTCADDGDADSVSDDAAAHRASHHVSDAPADSAADLHPDDTAHHQPAHALPHHSHADRPPNPNPHSSADFVPDS